MPYESKAQAAFMHIHHPDIAKRWDKEYDEGKIKRKKMPEHVKKEASAIEQRLLLQSTIKLARHVKKGGIMDVMARLGAKVGPALNEHVMSPVLKGVESVGGGSLGSVGASIANKVKPAMQGASNYLGNSGNKMDWSHMAHMGPATVPAMEAPNAARNIGLATTGLVGGAGAMGLMSGQDKQAALPLGLLGALGGAGIGAATADEGHGLGGAVKGGLVGGGLGLAAGPLAKGFKGGFGGVGAGAAKAEGAAAGAAASGDGVAANKALASTGAGGPKAALPSPKPANPIVRGSDIAEDFAARNRMSLGRQGGPEMTGHVATHGDVQRTRALNHVNRANIYPQGGEMPVKAGNAIGTPYTDGILSWCLKNNCNAEQVLDVFEKGAAQEGVAGQECKAFLDRLLAE